jgi:hypothetical protein
MEREEVTGREAVIVASKKVGAKSPHLKIKKGYL